MFQWGQAFSSENLNDKTKRCMHLWINSLVPHPVPLLKPTWSVRKQVVEFLFQSFGWLKSMFLGNHIMFYYCPLCPSLLAYGGAFLCILVQNDSAGILSPCHLQAAIWPQIYVSVAEVKTVSICWALSIYTSRLIKWGKTTESSLMETSLENGER